MNDNVMKLFLLLVGIYGTSLLHSINHATNDHKIDSFKIFDSKDIFI